MNAKCANCGTKTDVEAFSGLCVDCLIADARKAKLIRMAKLNRQPFDPKAAAAGPD